MFDYFCKALCFTRDMKCFLHTNDYLAVLTISENKRTDGLKKVFKKFLHANFFSDESCLVRFAFSVLFRQMWVKECS